MTTNTAGDQARQQHIQVIHSARFTVNYDDEGIADGVALFTLPMGAFITQVLVEIVTAFAGGTPILTVGTNSTSFNDIVAAADVDEATPAVTAVTRGLGRSLAAAAAKTVYAKVANVGTGTDGQAVLCISYEGNLG